ncbi:DUF6864 domain-containing function [Flavobacterium sp. LBUM151]
MITAISEKGIKRKLIMNESIILVEKSDKVFFDVENNNDDRFQLIFGFSEIGKEYSSTSNPTSDPNIYDITLNRWNGPAFIETTKPWELIRNNSSYWIHWRTYANEKLAQRVFEITIWTSQKN